MIAFIRCILKSVVAASLVWHVQGAALTLAPEKIQKDTFKEIISILESRHYEGKIYDDTLSAEHLDAYIDALDPQKMFFTHEEIESFQVWRTTLDDLGHNGNLTPTFTIFDHFQRNLRTRLESVLEQLPTIVTNFDYTVKEYLSIDSDAQKWAENIEELNDRWRKHIKNQALSLKLAEKPQDEITPILERRYRNQLNRITQYNERDVFTVYANALTKLYDPHTSYFSPNGAENFDIHMSLSFDGIGAVLQVDDEYAKVLRLTPAGPAEIHGELKPSDLIIGVGQGNDGPIENVIGWRLDEIVQLIRGPRETIVRLEVIPDKSKMDQRHVVAIQRNKVKLQEQAAKSKIIEIEGAGDKQHKLGVIDIPTFYIDFAARRRGDKNYKSTTHDVRKLINELEAEDIEGLIIDLRDNGGGSLQEANDLTGLFIEYGPIVQIRNAEQRVWREGKRYRSPYYEGPVVVLINRLSASASEIFAGAIQDYGRGLVLGARSFGKGTVQTLFNLPEGQLKVTESKFYRITGNSTQHRGVMPDIVFPSLFDQEKIGESSLEYALDWDQISPIYHHKYAMFTTLVPSLESQHLKRAANDPDFVYLLDQVEVFNATRDINQLPLSESERIAMRESQKYRALKIENKRRLAKGLEPLSSLQGNEKTLDFHNDSGENHSGLSKNVDAKGNTSDNIDSDANVLGKGVETISSIDPVVAPKNADKNKEHDKEADDSNKELDVLLIEAGRILLDAIAFSSS